MFLPYHNRAIANNTRIFCWRICYNRGRKTGANLLKRLCSKCNQLHDHDQNCTVGKFDKYYRDDEAYALRNSRKWWATRDQAKERDNYLCVACRIVDHYLNSKTLEVHHIKGVRDYPELVYVVGNCITLCRYHHVQVHKHGYELEAILAELPWYSSDPETPPTL